ncbi:MAG: hypothetical protein ABSC55_17945 [Syntrophorhabdales bacterium]
MKKLIGILVGLVLLSCTGPIQVAKNESEVFKTNYEDPDLARVYKMNEGALRNIYFRYKNAGVDFYYDGIAVIGLKDFSGKIQDHYVSIKIRPAEIVFDRAASGPDNWQQRLTRIMQKEFPKYIRYLKKSDLQFQDIEGLAFGIYWPRRDYTQCDKYGGCIEYAIVYLSEQDVIDILDGSKSFTDVAKGSKVVASFNLQPAQTIETDD